MNDESLHRAIYRLVCALEINEYYHMHTDADDGSRIRVENLQKCVEHLKGKVVEKEYLKEESDLERSSCVRYKEGSLIIVTEEDDESWIRYSIVKELCHVYCDGEEELVPDAHDSLVSMLPRYNSLDDLLAGHPNQQAEQTAELMAVELLYPLEFRRDDLESLSNGENIADIAARRGVPEKFVGIYLHENIHKAAVGLMKLAIALRQQAKEAQREGTQSLQ
jgi:Zn-dependent peptidase ImmA (M78 family)